MVSPIGKLARLCHTVSGLMTTVSAKETLSTPGLRWPTVAICTEHTIENLDVESNCFAGPDTSLRNYQGVDCASTPISDDRDEARISMLWGY